MSVDTGITRRASQVLVLFVGYVLVCSSISILFCKSEVNDVHEVAFLSETHEEIIGLDVSMDKIL